MIFSRSRTEECSVFDFGLRKELRPESLALGRGSAVSAAFEKKEKKNE